MAKMNRAFDIANLDEDQSEFLDHHFQGEEVDREQVLQAVASISDLVGVSNLKIFSEGKLRAVADLQYDDFSEYMKSLDEMTDEQRKTRGNGKTNELYEVLEKEIGNRGMFSYVFLCVVPKAAPTLTWTKIPESEQVIRYELNANVAFTRNTGSTKKDDYMLNVTLMIK